MEGYLDFYLGNPDNGGVLINDVQVNGTGAFQYYRTFRYNFYAEGGDVARPTGKGDVYIRYRECEGNLKKVVFYTEELSDSDMGEMKDPVYLYIYTSSGNLVYSDSQVVAENVVTFTWNPGFSIPKGLFIYSLKGDTFCAGGKIVKQ